MENDETKKTVKSTLADEPASLARLPKNLIESARIQDDRRKGHRGDIDRRQHERASVEAKADLCISLKNGIEGRLTNLSSKGCSLQLPTSQFAAGDSVWFRIDTIEPWKGTVRWVEKDRVGVEFDRPFYPAVYDLVVQLNKPVSVSKAA